MAAPREVRYRRVSPHARTRSRRLDTDGQIPRQGTAHAARAAGSCRMCPVSCDRVVYPSGCVESGCDRLYTYERHGRTVMGCLEKIFRVEIDTESFRALQRTRAGFGGLRVWRQPLARCRCGVEPTFEHRPHGDCGNPEFLASAPVVRA